MSYDPDVKLEYTSASPEMVIIHVQFITFVNPFHTALTTNTGEREGWIEEEENDSFFI